MFQCSISKSIWDKLFSWINSKSDIHIGFNLPDLVLGINQDDYLWFALNTIGCATKTYLYRCRCTETPPHFHKLLWEIEQMIDVEKTAAQNYGNVQMFNKRWSFLGFFIQ